MTALPAGELKPALRHVQQALSFAHVTETLTPLGVGSAAPRPTVDTMLRCYAALATATGMFGVAEQTILRALDIEPVFDSVWWGSLITDTARGCIAQTLAQDISALCTRVLLATRNYDRLALLLGVPADADTPGPTGFHVVVSAQDGRAPPLGRVAAAVDAIDLLGTALAELHGGDGAFRLVRIINDPSVELHFLAGDDPLTHHITALLATIGEHLAAVPDTITAQHRAAAILTLLPIEQRLAGRPDGDRLHALLEAGISRLLEAEWIAPEPAAAQPAFEPPPVEAPSAMMLDLVSVIAEERRQLAAASSSARRLWSPDRLGDGEALPFPAIADKTR